MLVDQDNQLAVAPCRCLGELNHLFFVRCLRHRCAGGFQVRLKKSSGKFVPIQAQQQHAHAGEIENTLRSVLRRDVASETYAKSRTFSVPTLHGDVSAHHVDKAPADRQTQPRAAEAPRG